MIITRCKPLFGQTYDVGWLGFTRSFDTIGDAIAFGERKEIGAGYPSVNHALVVIGDGQCVQAHIDNGVQRGALAQYLDDPKSRVYFRRLRGWTPALGQRVAAAALSKVGDEYSRLGIAEMAAADTLLGQFLNELTHHRLHQELAQLLTSPNAYICSQLDAFAVATQPEFENIPALKLPLASIDPQTLFQVEELYEETINDCSYQP